MPADPNDPRFPEPVNVIKDGDSVVEFRHPGQAKPVAEFNVSAILRGVWDWILSRRKAAEDLERENERKRTAMDKYGADRRRLQREELEDVRTRLATIDKTAVDQRSAPPPAGQEGERRELEKRARELAQELTNDE